MWKKPECTHTVGVVVVKLVTGVGTIPTDEEQKGMARDGLPTRHRRRLSRGQSAAAWPKWKAKAAMSEVVLLVFMAAEFRPVTVLCLDGNGRGEIEG